MTARANLFFIHKLDSIMADLQGLKEFLLAEPKEIQGPGPKDTPGIVPATDEFFNAHLELSKGSEMAVSAINSLYCDWFKKNKGREPTRRDLYNLARSLSLRGTYPCQFGHDRQRGRRGLRLKAVAPQGSS